MEQDIRVGEWRVRPDLNLIQRSGERVNLEPRAMQLLLHLMRHARQVCSRESLLDEVWGGAFVSDEALSNAVRKLRKALGDDPRHSVYIQTIPKRGYRLLAEVQWDEPSEAEERFEVVERIGQGRMGEVFLARDRVLGRQVALKFLNPGLENGKAARRLLREARVAASLDHPSICSVYDCGQLEGRSYIAMEYLQGSTLQQRLEAEHRLAPREVLHWGRQVSAALGAAHERGILHRDLKPSNLIITPEGRVKVMDFGQARRLPHSQAAQQDWSSTLTEAGPAAAEYAYQSPEQIKARGELDVRSDVFSLGLILYESLCGRHPFERESPVETAVAILSDPPPQQSDFPSGVPARLRRLVLQMLAGAPEQRPSSMKEVGQKLDRIHPKHRTLRIVLWASAAGILVLFLAWLWWG